MKLSRTRQKTLAGVAGLALLAVPLAACGSSSSDSSSSSSGTVLTAAATVKDLSANKGQTTQVTLDSKFLPTLDSLGVSVTPYGSAKVADGAAIFPITGGWVSLFDKAQLNPYVIGQIQHVGSGLNLTAGKTTVTIGNFNVDPGRSLVYGDVAVNKTIAATDVPIFSLDGSTLMPAQTEGSNVILEGTKVYISSVAAGLLNSTFKTDAVTNKVLVGIAKITVNKTPAAS